MPPTIQTQPQESLTAEGLAKASQIKDFLEYAARERVPESETDRLLKDDRKALREILRKNPILDEKGVEALFPLALRFPEIALELVYTRILSAEQVNRLVDAAMSRWDEDDKWNSVVLELVANPEDHAKLSSDSLSKIEKNEATKEYLEIWEKVGKSNRSVVKIPTANKPRGKTRNKTDKKLAI